MSRRRRMYTVIVPIVESVPAVDADEALARVRDLLASHKIEVDDRGPFTVERTLPDDFYTREDYQP